MKISIVIPVYNEEDTLEACLSSIESQTVKPDEVIVVNNNSTDNSILIASKFDFVTIISENSQGIASARSTGFNYAKSDIIGRIDADTVMERDWVENLYKIFSDESISAVSGKVDYYDGIWPSLNGKVDNFFRQRLSQKMSLDLFLYGANMAITKKSWKQISSQVCVNNDIHEDIDLSIHLLAQNLKIIYSNDLKVKISCRRFSKNLMEVSEYAKKTVQTYGYHGKKPHSYFYIIWASLYLFYWYIFLNAVFYKKSLRSMQSGYLS